MDSASLYHGPSVSLASPIPPNLRNEIQDFFCLLFADVEVRVEWCTSCVTKAATITFRLTIHGSLKPVGFSFC